MVTHMTTGGVGNEGSQLREKTQESDKVFRGGRVRFHQMETLAIITRSLGPQGSFQFCPRFWGEYANFRACVNNVHQALFFRAYRGPGYEASP